MEDHGGKRTVAPKHAPKGPWQPRPRTRHPPCSHTGTNCHQLLVILGEDRCKCYWVRLGAVEGFEAGKWEMKVVATRR